MQLNREYTLDIEHRFRYLLWAIAAFFFIIIFRLYMLQIVQGEFYSFFSTENSIKEITHEAPRGRLLDRRGQILVENRPAFDLIITPQYVIDPAAMQGSLSRILSVPLAELESIWERRKGKPRYQPLVVKTDIAFDDVSLIHSRKNPWHAEGSTLDLRGVDVRMGFSRSFGAGDIAAHLIGYVREIDAERLKMYKQRFPGRYKLGDRIGVRGLEERYDIALRGKDGFEQRVVNAVGREIQYEGIARELVNTAAQPGEDLQLTVDRDLQLVAREQFAGKRGAAVMIEVETGNILALFSAPSYDLGQLAGPDGSEYWKTLETDPQKPLLNRAVQGVYPPASTYKIVTAVAALAEGVVKPDERISCGGAYVYGGRPYHCWLRSGHGAIALKQAIAASCDVYFYVMGLRLGVDRIAKYAQVLGLGRRSGIPLADEKSGLIPTAEWKLARFKEPWQEGETLSIAVGQGYDLVTPLQNAMMAARVANRGKPIRAQLLHAAQQAAIPSADEGLAIADDVFDRVHEGMRAAIAEAGGTARRLATLPIAVAGKTGTAQVIALDRGAGCHAEWCRDHAWFIGFAPVERPRVAVAVIVENGGFGASVAAPIAGALFQKYAEIEAEESKSTETPRHPRLADDATR